MLSFLDLVFFCHTNISRRGLSRSRPGQTRTEGQVLLESQYADDVGGNTLCVEDIHEDTQVVTTDSSEGHEEEGGNAKQEENKNNKIVLSMISNHVEFLWNNWNNTPRYIGYRNPTFILTTSVRLMDPQKGLNLIDLPF